MDDRQKHVLDTANTNLKKLFPHMRIKPITLSDIEKVYSRNVLGIGADTKTKKGDKRGYMTGIMYLAPAKLSGINMCPMASQGCAAACLFTAGRGAFASITKQRMIKTLAFHFDRVRFIETIKKSIRSLLVKAKNKGMVPIVRLNGTSDILWERVTDIIQSFPDVQFYDYTKIAARFAGAIPVNYDLTFSVSESNETDALKALSLGYNIAAVFRGALPSEYLGYPVINGDETDLRFLDQRGAVVGLKAKGKAKKDTSGFVKESESIQNERLAA